MKKMRYEKRRREEEKKIKQNRRGENTRGDVSIKLKSHSRVSN